MLTALIIWFSCGLLGSIFIGLGTSLDGEGIDRSDVLILLALSVAGPFWMLVSIPFGFMWLNSLFEDKK